MDIANVFSFLYPGTPFVCGDDYESLVVLEGGKKPSMEELEEAYPLYLEALQKKKIPQLVADFFENAIKEFAADLTPLQRYKIYETESTCLRAFQRTDFEAGAEGIKQLEIPEALKPVRDQILQMIGGA